MTCPGTAQCGHLFNEKTIAPGAGCRGVIAMPRQYVIPPIPCNRLCMSGVRHQAVPTRYLFGSPDLQRREPPSEPQARPAEPGDCSPGHLLQHQGGRAIARKKRQAHARVAHCNGCVTGAVTVAPSVGEPAHHPLDRMGFYGFGQTLKPAICEKCRNPKNSDNAVPARHQRMIVGLCL